MFSNIRKAALALVAIAALGAATLVTSATAADAMRGGGSVGTRHIGGPRIIGGSRLIVRGPHLGRHGPHSSIRIRVRWPRPI